MLNKKLMILAIFLVSLLAISAVSAEENVTSDVVGVDDNDNIIENVNDDYKISDDFRNKTTFGGLVYNIDNSADGNVYLDKDYKFNGTEYDIDPETGAQILVVDERGITLNRSLTIHGNGHTIDAGNAAAFFNVNSIDIILKDINFVNGINTGEDSPIVWRGDNGAIDNCTFSNFKSGFDGGVIKWVGDKGKITNCNFTDCYAINAGAILWNGDEGTVSNCNFDNCTPHDNVGSIKWVGFKGTVTGCNFSNCDVNNGKGAAIMWEGDDGTVINSNFANLGAKANGYTDGGGAIYWSGANGIMSNSNFINTTVNWNGGAINWHNVRGTITGCNFFNCSAGNSGAAIYIHSEDCTISNSNFTACDNGAIHLNKDKGVVKNSNFFNCIVGANNGGAILVSSPNCTVSNSNFANCIGTVKGGAINWIGDDGAMTDCTFDNCHANDYGAVLWTGTNAVISNSNFTNCYSSSGSGGAIGVEGHYRTFTILNSNFINCSSNGHGGAIFWKDGNGNDYNVNNSYFFNCSAVSQGGAIYGGVNVYNSNFDKCSANEGGAMFKGSATNCMFTDNKAKIGGAKHSADGSTINCTFIGNTASEYAGAVYGNSITNCTFTNNAANSTGGSIQGAQSVLNCNFTNSYANGSGGAIYGAKSVVNCNFNNCHAIGGDGGAVRFYDYGEFVDNCYFTDCSANASGGAVYKSGNGGAMYNSNFINCAANADGGAIWSNARSSVANCTFTNNLATSDGGAVKGGKAINCSFNGNSANRGGALSWSEARNCTFYDNTASEGNNWYDTKVPILNLNVANFNSIYGLGETILLNATENGIAVNDVIITIRVSKNGTSVANYSCLTNNEWLVDLDAGSYKAVMTVEHHAYKFDNANNNKVIALTINQRPTNITALNISTVYGADDYLIITLRDFQDKNVSGKIISVDLNGVNNYTTDENGQIKVPTKSLPANDYVAVITFDGTGDNYNTSTASANVTVNKASTSIAADPVTTVYNGGKYIIATLTDVHGNPIKGVSVSTNIKSLKAQTTNKKGQVTFLTDGLAPIKTYSVVLTFAGNDNYLKSTKTVKVKVVKATPKFVYKAQTFKRTDKKKQYAVKLLTNQNKAIKYTKVYIKVNKKTYTATTNKKGIAVFKLTKLTKKGKYTAKIMFNGDSYYTKLSKNVKVAVK